MAPATPAAASSATAAITYVKRRALRRSLPARSPRRRGWGTPGAGPAGPPAGCDPCWPRVAPLAGQHGPVGWFSGGPPPLGWYVLVMHVIMGVRPGTSASRTWEFTGKWLRPARRPASAAGGCGVAGRPLHPLGHRDTEQVQPRG